MPGKERSGQTQRRPGLGEHGQQAWLNEDPDPFDARQLDEARTRRPTLQTLDDGFAVTLVPARDRSIPA